ADESLDGVPIHVHRVHRRAAGDPGRREGGRPDRRGLSAAGHGEDHRPATTRGRRPTAGGELRLQLQQLQRDRAAHRRRAVPRRGVHPRCDGHPHLDGLPDRLRRIRSGLRLRGGGLRVPLRAHRSHRGAAVPHHPRPRERPLRRGTEMTSMNPARPEGRRGMPAGRWFAEIGWRYLVGVAAIAFAAIPILYVLSASLNPLGSVASTDLIPRQVSLVNYETLLSGAKGPFLRWYANTVVVCVVVSATQVFLSLVAAYAFSRMRFTGRRGRTLALTPVLSFPAV